MLPNERTQPTGFACLASLPTPTRKILLELAASNKVAKYAGLSSQGEFVPIAMESHSPINMEWDALQFLSKLGRLLVETSGNVQASSFLFNRVHHYHNF